SLSEASCEFDHGRNRGSRQWTRDFRAFLHQRGGHERQRLVAAATRRGRGLELLPHRGGLATTWFQAGRDPRHTQGYARGRGTSVSYLVSLRHICASAL